jgi:elongation factor P
MATTADIRNGLCIEFNDDIFQIIEFQHAQVGRGAAHDHRPGSGIHFYFRS